MTIGGRRCERSHHGCQPPLFDVGLNKDEASLTKVDVNLTSTIGSDSREEIVAIQADEGIFESLAVAGEEDGSGSRTVADANHVALTVGGTIGLCCKGIIVTFEAVTGKVADRVLGPTGQAKLRVGLGGETDGDVGVVGLVEHLDLPIVDLVDLGQGQIALNADTATFLWSHALAVCDKGNLGSGFDKDGRVALVIRVKGPGTDALFLDAEELAERDVCRLSSWWVSKDPFLGTAVAALNGLLYGLEPALLDAIQTSRAFKLFLPTDVERAVRITKRDASPASNDDDENDKEKKKKEQSGEEDEEGKKER